MFKNLIGGEWVEGTRVRRNINPSDTRDVVGEYAQADAEQARQAIGAAVQAQTAWGVTTPQQRFDILDAAGAEILARKQELGDLLAREEGKTLPEAIGEVARAGSIFKYFAGEALRAGGDLMPSVRPGITVEVTREPLGVVGLITPWNFPIAIPAWKMAPALAFGNAVVLKPADLVPGCAWALADILHRNGLPPGVLNLVMGRGAEVGQVLLEDRRVNAISFTGSVATGQRIAQACAARMAKFQLEMGGKNPMVVLDDADLNVAVGAAINSGFFSTGQRCTASSRVIVTEGIHDRFVEALAAKMKTLKVDDARKAGTDIGPVVDESQLAQDLKYIGIGKAEGARLVAGGERIERNAGGA
ncbi:MAG TPA: aldehyde dehydrogenase family protein, partial [Ramlibacter sp.]|nr:aldehyde dehydrogenase family protein [Ramlibacter sp.]